MCVKQLPLRFKTFNDCGSGDDNCCNALLLRYTSSMTRVAASMVTVVNHCSWDLSTEDEGMIHGGTAEGTSIPCSPNWAKWVKGRVKTVVLYRGPGRYCWMTSPTHGVLKGTAAESHLIWVGGHLECNWVYAVVAVAKKGNRQMTYPTSIIVPGNVYSPDKVETWPLLRTVNPKHTAHAIHQAIWVTWLFNKAL